MNTSPTQFKPESLEDFYGPARKIAEQIKNMATLALGNGHQPAALLFYGDPGTSKSMLARFAMKCFGVTQWNLTEFTGCDMTVDYVRDLANQMHYTSIYPGYRGYQFDEIDAMKRDAQVRWLTMSDRLPPDVVIAATCNSHIDELEPRFHRRFQCFEVVGPTAPQIVPLLERWMTNEEAKKFAHLASIDSTGRPNTTRPLNVGAVLSDVKTYIERKKPQNEAMQITV